MRLLPLASVLLAPATSLAQSVPAVDRTADGGWRLSLPPAYASALRAAGIQPTTAQNFREASATTPRGASGAVVLPGPAGSKSVILAGVTRDSVVVVLMRVSAGQVVVQRLTGEPWASVMSPEDARYVRTDDGTGPRVGRVLTLHRSGGAQWVRWQDGDCKERGSEWLITPVGTVAQTRRSRCVYSE